MTSFQTFPFVSVIIPVLDDYARLKKCIDALEKQSYPEGKFEVIVVDNGSKYHSEHISSEVIKITYFEEKRIGSYAARNLGIAFAEGEVCAFTDADCIPCSDWILQGVSSLLSVQKCGLIAGRVKIFSEANQHLNPVERYEELSAFRQQEYVNLGKFGVTANLFAYKSIFDIVGLFNSDLISSGDKEWGRRVHRMGYKVVYADAACICHPARSTLAALRRKTLRVALGLHQLSVIEEDQRANFLLRRAKKILQGILDIFRTVKFACVVLMNSNVSDPSKRFLIASIACYTRYLNISESIRLEIGFSPRVLR